MAPRPGRGRRLVTREQGGPLRYHADLCGVGRGRGWSPVRPSPMMYPLLANLLFPSPTTGELGHGGFDPVRRAYGSHGTIRHPSEVVEYPIEQHREAIPRERLGVLRVA